MTGWTLFGIFYLLYGVAMDMYFYVRVLCDYKLDNDKYERIQEETLVKDKIVIYNEIIDTIRSIIFLFGQRKTEIYKKDKVIDDNEGNIDLMEALERQAGCLEIDDDEGEDDGEDIKEGYTIHKKIIKMAWLRYRPKVSSDSEDTHEKDTMKGIYEPRFIDYMMSKIRLKIYEYKETQN